jgi:Undecaprenyl-phosphate glucose phosphotransferase
MPRTIWTAHRRTAATVSLLPRSGIRERSGHNRQLSTSVVSGLLMVHDVAVILAGSYVAYLLWLVHDPYSVWSDYGIVTILGALLGINVFHIAGLYEFELLGKLGASIKRMTGSWTLVVVTLIAVSFLTKTSSDYSRLWSALWFSLVLATLVLSRWLMYRRIRYWSAQGLLSRNVAIVGRGAPVERLLRQLEADPDVRLRLIGVFTDGSRGDVGDNSGPLVMGNLDALEHHVRSHAVDTVIVAGPCPEEGRLLRIFGRLRGLPIDVLYCPTGMWFPLAKWQFCHFASMPMMTIFHRPLSDWRSIVKELEDRVLATLILLLIAPLMAAIALLIKLDSPGPVFFRQKRYGLNNRLIEIFKFRTMHHALRDPNAEQLTRRNDPRITRLGAFLRRSSLDELPQFINVLRGEMSIVGPRPHALSAKAAGRLYPDAVRQYASRHRVKPGITGWAQVNGWRGETDTLEQIRKRVEHDLIYIDNWSLWLDLKIIVLTVLKGLTGKNAF